MANLRDRETGLYSHPAISEALGAEGADRILRQSHYQVFSQWLVFSLAEQKEDLDEFLGEPAARERLAAYRNLPPARAREVERQLYLTDLETLLELLIVEQGAVSRSRRA